MEPEVLCPLPPMRAAFPRGGERRVRVRGGVRGRRAVRPEPLLPVFARVSRAAGAMWSSLCRVGKWLQQLLHTNN